MIHNMFSDEISQQRRIIDIIGSKRYKNEHHAYSYKEQALHELALRLFYEETIDNLNKRIIELVDKVELLELNRSIK